MAKQKAKEKLSPIPKPKHRAAQQQADAARSAAAAPVPVPAPLLDHIAEGLRPLAVPCAELAFMVGNPLRHPEKQIEDLKASLAQFGQVEPLIVNRRAVPPVVIGGNGRLQAALALGWSHVAVCYVDISEARANALAVALNRSREGAEWDKEALDKLLRDVDTGCDERLDALLADLAREQKIVPPEEGQPMQPENKSKEPNMIACPACGHEFAA